MKSGEIDRQIAEKVMEWDKMALDRDPTDYYWDLRKQKRTHRCVVWNPSANIAHAFEVVDKMDEDGFDYRILCDHDSEKTEYEVEFYKLLTNGSVLESGGRLFYDKKEKAMAICLAALKAVKEA